MKLLKKFIFVPLLFIPCIAACAALWTTSPPKPYTHWPFDLTKRNSTINQEFRIVEYRSYIFAITISCLNQAAFNQADCDHVFSITNGAEMIAIPIHIKITKYATGDAPPVLVYESTITTNGAQSGTGRSWNREIVVIDLKPGIYRVEATTIEDRPEFANTKMFLLITDHPTVKFE